LGFKWCLSDILVMESVKVKVPVHGVYIIFGVKTHQYGAYPSRFFAKNFYHATNRRFRLLGTSEWFLSVLCLVNRCMGLCCEFDKFV
jgi:hypothetical protein